MEVSSADAPHIVDGVNTGDKYRGHVRQVERETSCSSDSDGTEVKDAQTQNSFGALFSKESVKEIFKLFDTDGDRMLASAEYRSAMKAAGVKLDADESHRLLHKYDTAHADGLRFHEFWGSFREAVALLPTHGGDFGDSKRQKKASGPSAKAKGNIASSSSILPQARDMGWTPADIGTFKTVFAIFDEEGDGNIEAAEVRSVLHALGATIDDAGTAALCRVADFDGDGQIDFVEFLYILAIPEIIVPTEQPPILTLLKECGWADTDIPIFNAVFAAFDVHEDKSIRATSLPHALKALGVPQNKLSDILADVKADGPNKLDFIDFLYVLKSAHASVTVKPKLLSLIEETRWTAFRIADYIALFSIFDKDGNDSVTAGEIESVLKSIGYTMPESGIERLMDELIGTDADEVTFIGFLTLVSFLELKDQQAGIYVKHRPSLIEAVESMRWTSAEIFDLHKKFKEKTKNHEEINKQDLIEVLAQMAQNAEYHFINNVVANADDDGTGMFDFIDFLLAFSRIATSYSVECAAMVSSAEMRGFFNLRDFIRSLATWLRRADEGETAQEERPPVSDAQKTGRKRCALKPTLAKSAGWLLAKKKKYVKKRCFKAFYAIINSSFALNLQVHLQDLVVTQCKHTLRAARSPASDSTRGYSRAFMHWMGVQRCRVGVSPQCKVVMSKRKRDACTASVSSGAVSGPGGSKHATARIAKIHDLVNAHSTNFRTDMLRQLHGDPTLQPSLVDDTDTIAQQWPPIRAMKGMSKPPTIGQSGWLSDPVPLKEVSSVPALPRCPSSTLRKSEGTTVAPFTESGSSRPLVSSTFPPEQRLFYREMAWAEQMAIGNPSFETRDGGRWPEEVYLEHSAKRGVLNVRSLACVADKRVLGMQPWMSDGELHSLADTIRAFDVPKNPCKEILLEDNRLTQQSRDAFTKIFAKTPQCEVLTLRDGKGLGGAAKGLISVLEVAPRTLKRLDISGIVLGSSSWTGLANLLGGFIHLSDLSLAQMQLGHTSQNMIVKIMEAMADLGRLKKIDLSHNNFRREGCQALIELLDESPVTDLSIAYNSGGPQRTFHDADLSSWETAYEPSYNPLLIVLERIMSVPRLTTLDLTFCAITYPCCFVLEGNLRHHPALHTLILADNPIGIEGMECLVRLAATSKCINSWRLNNVRSSVNNYARVRFDAYNPSGAYIFDMRNPFFREFARQAMQWCKEKKISPDAAFQACRIGKENVAPGDLVAATRSVREGVLTMTLWAELELGGHTNGRMLEKWQRERTVSLSLRRFATMSQFWEICESPEQQHMFLSAITKVASLKLGQMKWMVTHSHNGVSANVLIRWLLPAVEGDNMQVLDMAPRTHSRPLVLQDVQHLLYFNPDNPTKNYVLDLTKLVDYSVAERLLVVHKWERHLAKLMNLADTSPNQDGQNIHNLHVNRKPRPFTDDFTLPEGHNPIISFDYTSPIRVDKNAPSTNDRAFDSLLDSWTSSRSTCYSKIFALRRISHRIVLTLAQFMKVLQLEGVGKKARCTKEVLVACFQDLQEPRVELCVMFFNRCADRRNVCSPTILYNPALFRKKDFMALEKQLCRLNTFDFINICQKTVPLPNGTEILSNFGNEYELTLSKPEDRRLMTFFLQIATKEAGEHFCRTWYSEKPISITQASESAQLSDFVIPVTWLNELPTVGTIKFTYESEKENCILYDMRMEGAVKFGNWGDMPILQQSKMVLSSRTGDEIMRKTA
eukprot:GEMP01001273.1.p1 GENE.GEMP01001273.1~~GEMP01001273.1.p1  ORF type:complete len:1723 (+),score=387.41 GEMP01001273.1:89-5257(+)